MLASTSKHAMRARPAASRAPSASVPPTTRTLATDSETRISSAPTLNNVGPEPKRFSVGEGQLLDIATAALPALLRLGSGAVCAGYSLSIAKDDGNYGVVKAAGYKLAETSQVGSYPRPAQPLELYEFEGCPFCAKVREAISILDLEVIMYPCPKGGKLWRPKAIKEGGKQQFPYLVDPNTGKAMYESDDIIQYLFTAYGNAEVPLLLRLGFFTTLSAGLGSIFRVGKGNKAVPSRQPAEPLVLYGYQASPFVKVVREQLCAMELPYRYVNTARGSPRREDVLAEFGHFQVPLLVDPNINSYCFESGAIIRYLQHQYGADA